MMCLLHSHTHTTLTKACMHTHTHTQTLTYLQARMHTRTHAHTHTHTFTHILSHTHRHTHIHTHTHTHTHHTYTSHDTYIHTDTYTLACTHISTQSHYTTHRHTHILTRTHTHIHTRMHTHTLSHTHTHTQCVTGVKARRWSSFSRSPSRLQLMDRTGYQLIWVTCQNPCHSCRWTLRAGLSPCSHTQRSRTIRANRRLNFICVRNRFQQNLWDPSPSQHFTDNTTTDSVSKHARFRSKKKIEIT